MNKPDHDLVAVPDGMSLGEFLPTFADVKHEVLIGKVPSASVFRFSANR